MRTTPVLAPPPLASSRSSTRSLAIALLAALIATLWFTNLGGRHLADPDEGRYAEIPLAMLRSGDWVTPRLNGLKYFEKPPLQYWITAVAYHVAGPGETAARLWPALAGALTVLLTWLAARRLNGSRGAPAAALLLLASPYFVAFGHIATLDMGLTLFLNAALFSYAFARASEELTHRRRWMLAAWAAMALAVLSKGLIGVVLPVGAVIVHAGWSAWQRRTMRGGWSLPDYALLPGGLLFLAIAAPWFVAVSIANPEFPRFFFLHEHFARFTSNVHYRSGPWWYYLPILAFALLPWLPAAWYGLAAARRERRWPDGSFDLRGLLLVWIAVVLLFFSAAGSKLPAYILPLLPAVALLAANQLSRLDASTAAALLLPSAALTAIAAAAGAWLAPQINAESELSRLITNYSRWIYGSAGIVALGTIAAAWCWVTRRSPLPGLAAYAVACLAAAQLLVSGFEEMSPSRSTWNLAKIIADEGPGLPVYSVERFDQTLPAYLKQPVGMVAYEGELSLGQRTEPGRSPLTLEGFAARWSQLSDGFALMSTTTHARLKHLPMRVVHQEYGRILVRRK